MLLELFPNSERLAGEVMGVEIIGGHSYTSQSSFMPRKLIDRLGNRVVYIRK